MRSHINLRKSKKRGGSGPGQRRRSLLMQYLNSCYTAPCTATTYRLVKAKGLRRKVQTGEKVCTATAPLPLS